MNRLTKTKHLYLVLSLVANLFSFAFGANPNSLNQGNPNNGGGGHNNSHHQPENYNHSDYNYFDTAGIFMQEDSANSPTKPDDNDKNDFVGRFNCLFEVQSTSSIVQRVKCQFNILADGASDTLSIVANAAPGQVRLSTLSNDELPLDILVLMRQEQRFYISTIGFHVTRPMLIS